MPYDFRKKSKQGKFFKAIFEKNHTITLSPEIGKNILFPMPVGNSGELIESEEEQTLWHTVSAFVVQIQVTMLGQPEDIKNIIAKKGALQLLIELKNIYRHQTGEDPDDEEGKGFFDYLGETLERSILWRYDEELIKDHVVIYFVQMVLLMKENPTKIIKFHHDLQQLILNTIYNTNETISLHQASWQEITSRTKQQYRAMTTLQVPIFSLVTCGGVILGSTLLGLPPTISIPAVIGSVGWLSYSFGIPPKRLLNKKTEKWLIGRLSDDFLLKIKDKSFSGAEIKIIINNNISANTRNYIFSRLLLEETFKHMERAYLNKKTIWKDQQNVVIYARQDIFWQAEKNILPETSISSPQTHSTYSYFFQNFGISAKEVKTINQGTVPNDNKERIIVQNKRTTPTQTFFWKHLDSQMDNILPMKTKGGGLQFIGLAVDTLRQQIREHRLPDNLLESFIHEFQRVAEGKTENFRKLMNTLCSRRPIQFAEDEVEGKFECELTLKKDCGLGTARVFLHTAIDTTGEATLYYGCWFDPKGLHDENSKSKFSKAQHPLIISEEDMDDIPAMVSNNRAISP